MKSAILLAIVLSLILPAAAAEEKKGGDAKPTTPGTNIRMEYLMAPLTNAAGKLIGYAYIVPRLTAAAESLVVPVTAKKPYIQDAFVRDVNTKGVATAADPQAVDVPALEARLMADAVKVLGPGKIKMITVCTVNVSELRPGKVLTAEPDETVRDTDAHHNPLKSRCDPDKAG